VNLSLLITDDERMDREGLARQLDWRTYSICDVYVAKDGPSALQILKEQKVDILFSDIKMPIMSGLELAEKAREIHEEIEIVFISGYDDFSYAKKAININVHEYLLKPVSTEELKACVANLVEKIKNRRNFERASSDNNFQEGIPLTERQKRTRSNVAVQQVIEYVEENYMDNITLEKIAKVMYYTPNYLGNVFRQETNQRFSEYLMEYRIRQAALLLHDRNIKILEASISVGYRNIPTFIKNFKAVFGVTPSDYRKYL